VEDERNDYVGGVGHPNREKPESKQTRAIVTFLLLASAGILTVIAIGGWEKFQGAKPVTVFYILVYLLFAYYVYRWNRGVLPVSMALAVILIIFAAVAGPAWFERDKAGFDSPPLPEPLLGMLTLALIPVSLLLIFFSLRGFQQGWNIEEGSRADLEARGLLGQPGQPDPRTAP
jgi:presenilin-like A22 family membrane protease